MERAASTAHQRFLADTHEVKNVARELVDYNLYAQDAALQEARGAKAPWAATLAPLRRIHRPRRVLELARSRTGIRPSSTPTTASATASTWCASIRRTTR